MTPELQRLRTDLDRQMFRYVYVSTALDVFNNLLVNEGLQKAFNLVLQSVEHKMNTIHFMMPHDTLAGVMVDWYPPMSPGDLLPESGNMTGFVLGVTQTRFLSYLDLYLFSLLERHYQVTNPADLWGQFKRRTGIDLMSCEHGSEV